MNHTSPANTEVLRNRLKIPSLSFYLVFFFVSGLFFLRFTGVFVLLFIGGITLSILYIFLSQKTTRIGLLILSNYVFWFLSGFLVGSIKPGDLISVAFLNGDGRIFIYYLPLISLSFMHVRLHDIGYIERLLKVMACLILGATILYYAGAISTVHFLGFFTHHTGAGTFIGINLIVLAITGISRKKKQNIFFSILLIVPFVAAGSREAMFGLFCVALWYVAKKRKLVLILWLFVFCFIILLLAPYFAPIAYERTISLVNPETFETAKQGLESIVWEPGYERKWGGGLWNVVWRVVYWRYALSLIIKSPLIGVGFGRFNDYNLHFSGFENLAYVAVGGKNRFDVLQAHNSYLHFMSEVGILGMIFILSVWWMLYKRVSALESVSAAHPLIKGHAEAAQGIVVFCLSAAFFGHALGAPTTGIIAMSLLGWYSSIDLHALRLFLETNRVEKISLKIERRPFINNRFYSVPDQA